MQNNLQKIKTRSQEGALLPELNYQKQKIIKKIVQKKQQKYDEKVIERSKKSEQGNSEQDSFMYDDSRTSNNLAKCCNSKLSPIVNHEKLKSNRMAKRTKPKSQPLKSNKDSDVDVDADSFDGDHYDEEDQLEMNQDSQCDLTIQQQSEEVRNFVKDLRQNEENRLQKKNFKCKFCKKQFNSTVTLFDHQAIVHSFEMLEDRNGEGFLCTFCYKYFEKDGTRDNHENYYCPKRPDQNQRVSLSSYQLTVQSQYNSMLRLKHNNFIKK